MAYEQSSGTPSLAETFAEWYTYASWRGGGPTVSADSKAGHSGRCCVSSPETMTEAGARDTHTHAGNVKAGARGAKPQSESTQVCDWL